MIKDKVVHTKYMVSILLLSEVAIFNIYKLYSVINDYDITTYVQFWVLLIPPIIFMITIHVLLIQGSFQTEEEMDKEFHKNIGATFVLMSIYVASHFLPMMNPEHGMQPVRLASISLLLLYAYFRKDYLFYLLVISWVVGLFVKINTLII